MKFYVSFTDDQYGTEEVSSTNPSLRDAMKLAAEYHYIGCEHVEITCGEKREDGFYPYDRISLKNGVFTDRKGFTEARFYPRFFLAQEATKSVQLKPVTDTSELREIFWKIQYQKEKI